MIGDIDWAMATFSGRYHAYDRGLGPRGRSEGGGIGDYGVDLVMNVGLEVTSSWPCPQS